jgi:hypothetical protein
MANAAASTRPLFALLAEYGSTTELLAAAQRATAAGYTAVEAYSPYPVHGIVDALGGRSTVLPRLIFAGGLLGALGGFGMQCYLTIIDYPLNIGGRPLLSWPAFMPVTFELAVLGAALTAVIGMLALNDLPRPHHPVFDCERFDLSAGDRFFLAISASDRLFDTTGTMTFLRATQPRGIHELHQP